MKKYKIEISLELGEEENIQEMAGRILQAITIKAAEKYTDGSIGKFKIEEEQGVCRFRFINANLANRQPSVLEWL